MPLPRITCIDSLSHLELGVDDLDDDLGVGEPDNKPVLGRVVLVLGLGYQSLPGVVVGLSFSSPPRLDLEPGEVGGVLLDLDERHFECWRGSVCVVTDADLGSLSLKTNNLEIFASLHVKDRLGGVVCPAPAAAKLGEMAKSARSLDSARVRLSKQSPIDLVA